MHLLDQLAFEAADERGIVYGSPWGALRIEAFGPRIARIRLGAPGAAPLQYVSGSPTAVTVRTRGEGASPATLETDFLRVELKREPVGLALGAPGREPSLSGGRISLSEESSGPFRVSFALPATHHFYGLGHGGGQLDRVGTQRQLWNSHTVHGAGSDFGVPLLISNRGYVLLFDNTYDARVTVGRTETESLLVYEAEGGPIDLYYLHGEDMRSALGLVADLLGRPPMPPRWFLGFLQSTRHFESTAEIEAVARGFRERGFPCDALIFLSTYNRSLGWNRRVGDLDFQPELFASPERVISSLRESHFKVILHEYPVVHRDSPLYEEAQTRGFLLREGYPDPRPLAPGGYEEGQRYIDFSDDQAGRWWWGRHRRLVELGVAGWWLDGGEGPPAVSKLAGGSGAALHNVYDLLRQRAFARGEADDRPGLRPVMICRSGAAGMQRYGAACWSGDIVNTFAAFEGQIALGLNTALSGITYWGTDIGGFFHPTVESGELFARWFQFGAFSPLFRAHGYVWRDHLPWAHGPEIEEICLEYARLRYRLLPYTYTLASQAARNGLPLMRPLVLNYPNDPRVWNIGDEYLWGDDLLVAPVTREGARRRALYLPDGVWYDFWSWERIAGGRGLEVTAPLERLPLFVREGAIIPMTDAVEHVDGWAPREVRVLMVPRTAGSFELYEDDGGTNAYRMGGFVITRLSFSVDEGRLVATVAPPEGDTRLLPSDRSYLLEIRWKRPESVVDGAGRPLPELSGPDPGRPGWWSEGGFVFVRMGEVSGTVTLIEKIRQSL